MRVLVLSSGGKDSTYACWWALLRGWAVSGIVTVGVENDDSMMFQIPATDIAGLQASAGDIPWLKINVSGDERSEMQELEQQLAPYISGVEHLPTDADNSTHEQISFGAGEPIAVRKLQVAEPIDAIVCGALRSDYQKTRIERMAENLGVLSFTPLWHNSAKQHMTDLLNHGFSLLLTSVSAEGLTREWVGQELDESTLSELFTLAESNRFACDGEGGEFETTVVAAPWFSGTIALKSSVHWEGRRGQLVIESASITE